MARSTESVTTSNSNEPFAYPSGMYELRFDNIEEAASSPGKSDERLKFSTMIVGGAAGEKYVGKKFIFWRTLTKEQEFLIIKDLKVALPGGSVPNEGDYAAASWLPYVYPMIGNTYSAYLVSRDYTKNDGSAGKENRMSLVPRPPVIGSNGAAAKSAVQNGNGAHDAFDQHDDGAVYMEEDEQLPEHIL